MSRVPTLVAWSSGKDSAWALDALRRSSDTEVVGLLTTVSAPHQRVSMHAVRRALLEAQAEAVDLPLRVVELPAPCSDADYQVLMAHAMERAHADGVRAVAFGDLFLADVRRYRERQLAGTGIAPLFPLWGQPTWALAESMLAAGLRAFVTCVDPVKLPADVAGRPYDRALLATLPPSADPCGERGEFHTFVWDGPAFRRPVPVRVGEVVRRDGFVFADLVPESTS
jgi:uncharacterized protein (TIGR00290 family)